MLNDKAWKSIQAIMKVGSFMKFVPFVWEPRSRRFIKAPIQHLVVFYFHLATAFSMGIFSAIRLAFALTQRGPPEVPNRIKVMTTLWTLVYSLEIVCFVQFHVNKDQIRYYANSLFTYIEKSRGDDQSGSQRKQNGGMISEFNGGAYRRGSAMSELGDPDEENDDSEPYGTIAIAQSAFGSIPAPKRISLVGVEAPTPTPVAVARTRWDWVSIFVQISTYLLITNPPTHSIMLSDNPCAPHFLSSLFLECKATDDKSQPILHKIPFVLIENFTITTVFYVLTFNWTMIFVGLAWIKEELQKSKLHRGMSEQEKLNVTMERIPINYRYIQSIAILMNDCFRLYLIWFPSILLLIISFLAFTIIRFYHLDFRSYMMFPLCGFRCAFETFTPLTLAGYVNNDCGRVLRDWKTEVLSVQGESGPTNSKEERSWIRRFQASCQFIRCSAGSLYTFENSIVLVTICNCTILTCNLLIMFKGKD